MREFTELEYRVLKRMKSSYFRAKSTLTKTKLVFDCERKYRYRSYYTLHCEILPEGENTFRVIVNGCLPIVGVAVGFRHYDALNRVVDYGNIPVRDMNQDSETFRQVIGSAPAADELELEGELAECLRRTGRMIEDMCMALGYLSDSLRFGYKAAGNNEGYCKEDDMMV